VPGITGIELIWGGYIQEEISKGSLKPVQGKVQNIEGNDSKDYGGIIRLGMVLSVQVYEMP
jgi:hypothetical protein